MDSILDKAYQLQNGLVARATGGDFEAHEYMSLRSSLTENIDTQNLVPDFVRRCRNLDQFWAWIKRETDDLQNGIWETRRQIIWEAFNPLLDRLEQSISTPSDAIISDQLEVLDEAHVSEKWTKALKRRSTDPEGAITLARTLLESACKIVLDEADIKYKDNASLPALWDLTSKHLNLAPSQHSEPAFKTILGNCQSIVQTIGNLRNTISDSHGKGKGPPVKPKARHAELVVNLAGTMAAFLAATKNAKN